MQEVSDLKREICWQFLSMVGFFLSTSCLAQQGPNEVFGRVIDSGAGLCCVVQMPGPCFIIYDPGNYAAGGYTTFDNVEGIIPLDSDVELLVLSNSGADHLEAVDEICDSYTAKRVLRSGYLNRAVRFETISIICERREYENHQTTLFLSSGLDHRWEHNCP